AYRAALLGQLALLAAAALEPAAPARPLRVARYYVLVTASLAAGLLDWLRTGTPAEWEKAEGTR
nr:glycosyltransferase family 2 protein [Thermoleophilaceae bacterium]